MLALLAPSTALAERQFPDNHDMQVFLEERHILGPEREMVRTVRSKCGEDLIPKRFTLCTHSVQKAQFTRKNV